MRALLNLIALAWRDLRGSGRTLWILCACLLLGVTLIAASAALHRQVSDSLLADTRILFGGDVEIHTRDPLPDTALAWMTQRGTVSQLIEFRTMLVTASGATQLVELQSFDQHYPLYGSLTLEPAQTLAAALSPSADGWGVALDRTLAERLALKVGDRVNLGDAELVVRAIILYQPDRSLRADWSGAPVLVSAGALQSTGLLQPGSRPAYRYRVRTDVGALTEASAWRAAFMAEFPEGAWEVRTFKDRNARIAEILGQIGSGVLLIGFSALFIGGLGVFNSIQAYLQGKLGTLATLRAIGLRDGRLAALYLIQVIILASLASLAGALLGGALAWLASGMIAARLPLASAWHSLPGTLAASWLFGVITAMTFALPALGRALSISPAALFRGLHGAHTYLPRATRLLTVGAAAGTAGLLIALVPDKLFGMAFVVALIVILLMLEGVVRGLRWLAERFGDHAWLERHFALRMAVASLHRPGSPLRATLISLGSALTLLVASTVVVLTLRDAINETVPDNTPAMVFYDVTTAQKDEFTRIMQASPSLTQLDLAPLVLGRLADVNGEDLLSSTDAIRRLEARDEHKMSHLQNNFDQVVLDRGAWWPADYRGPPLVAMEDREADRLGLQIGDQLEFEILGQRLSARLHAIYAQKRFQSRLWLEALFSEGALDPFITRYVGMAWLNDNEAALAQRSIAASQPNVVSVRTAALLDEARDILGRANAGLSAIAAVTLAASLLVLISVVAASRVHQVYLATLLHTLGTRLSVIRDSLVLEYLLLALLTSAFAALTGTTLATLLLRYRLQLDSPVAWWTGALVALSISVVALLLGALYLLRQLRYSPATLLRGS